MNKPGTARNILQGYVTNREFGGLRIPGTLQNLMLRDYAARNNLSFKLSIGEYSFPGCYLQLEGLLPQLQNFEGVGMCSMFMLPKDPKRREVIYQEFVKAGATLHLVLENILIRELPDSDRVEEALRLNQFFKNSPSSIPRELLPSLPLPDCFT